MQQLIRKTKTHVVGVLLPSLWFFFLAPDWGISEAQISSARPGELRAVQSGLHGRLPAPGRVDPQTQGPDRHDSVATQVAIPQAEFWWPLFFWEGSP